MEKNKKLAAVLNFLFWGIGYLYTGKRKMFGVLLFISLLFQHIPFIVLQGITFQSTTEVLLAVGHLVLSVALAYDVYRS